MPSRRRLLATAGSPSVAALAGCVGADTPDFTPGSDANTDWPMLRHDAANTAYAEDAAAPRDGVTERWSRSVPRAVVGLAVADGALFVGCEQRDGNPGLVCLEES